MSTSIAQQKASRKYNEKTYERLYIFVPKKKKDQIRVRSSECRRSVNEYVTGLIEHDLKNQVDLNGMTFFSQRHGLVQWRRVQDGMYLCVGQGKGQQMIKAPETGHQADKLYIYNSAAEMAISQYKRLQAFRAAFEKMAGQAEEKKEDHSYTSNIYALKHRDTTVAVLKLSRDKERVEDVVLYDPEHAPYLGNFTLENANKWWSTRAIPGHRENIQKLLLDAGCQTTGEYLAKNLALSLTDSYWICPVDLDLSWEDIDLYDHVGPGGIALYNGDEYDASSGLNGQLQKHWEQTDTGQFILIKESKRLQGLQNINEAFASYFHDRQGKIPMVDYVPYDVIMQNGNCVGSQCPSFSNKDQELVYAAEIIYSRKKRNDQSEYELFIQVCVENGISEKKIRRSLDYQMASDFILSNQDRHYTNFGVLRDPESLAFLEMAPIYDTGNSMYWDSLRELTRTELLDEPTHGFAKRSMDSLKYISDSNILDLEKVPEWEEVFAFYHERGIPETESRRIADNYANKVQLYRSFVNGESLYHQKKS